MQTFKTCRLCGKEKPLTTEYFNVAKRHKDGFRGECRQCRIEIIKQWRDNNKEAAKAYDKHYKETHKEEYAERDRNRDKKAKAEYNKQYRKRRADYFKEYRESHKEHISKQSKEYRELHKEACSLRVKQWSKENSDKRRIAGHNRRAYKRTLERSFTIEQWNACKEYFDNKCAYCGVDAKLTQDHFIPLAKKGEYTVNNIVPVCLSCNSSKCDKNFWEWYPKQTFYLKAREKRILKYLNYTVSNNRKIQQLSLM